jgi:hypothetical protein
MTIETITYILPEYLASYLINGDHSGLTDQEVTEIDQFLDREKVYFVSCTDDPYFAHRNDLNSLGSTVIEYTAILRK